MAREEKSPAFFRQSLDKENHDQKKRLLDVFYLSPGHPSLNYWVHFAKSMFAANVS